MKKLSRTFGSGDLFRKQFDDTVTAIEVHSVPLKYKCGTLDVDPSFDTNFTQFSSNMRILREFGGYAFMNGVLKKIETAIDKVKKEKVSVTICFKCNGKGAVDKMKRFAVHKSLTILGRHVGITARRPSYPQKKDVFKLSVIQEFFRKSSKRKRNVNVSKRSSKKAKK